jgi:hypothetical protein
MGGSDLRSKLSCVRRLRLNCRAVKSGGATVARRERTFINRSEYMPAKKLPTTAYVLREGETYVPFTHGQSLTEFTFKSAIAGIILGIVFGAANTYLGLKAGLTISTSIPVAVLTVVVFRLFAAFGVGYSILETNMSQTIGSASSSVASGVLFTIPALFIWNMNPEWAQITLLAMAGGLLGVLAMIPLRRYLIAREHGKLPYPEGMACAWASGCFSSSSPTVSSSSRGSLRWAWASRPMWRPACLLHSLAWDTFSGRASPP